jgi:4-amino-4-deoxy-L-arabinose transferase-like glycosyltransferase
VRQRLVISCLIIAILLAGLALRLYGLNWDQGYGLHPDERYVTWVAASIYLPDKASDFFDPAQTGLNPFMWPPDGRSPQDRVRPFSYGHFPLYLLVLVAGGDADEARLALVGRALSALFDTATILLVFALGRFLYGAAVGILAATLSAFTVMHVQLAHFATFDTALTCFVVATLLFAARFVRYGRRRDAVAMGLALGLAVGAKFNAVLLLLPVIMAHALRWEHLAWSGAGRRLRRPAGFLILTLLVAGVVFALTNPYALIQWGEFVDNLKDQSAMLRGDDNFPFTRQYHATLPFLYPIEQQLRWGMGWPLGLVALGGWGYALARAWRRPPRAETWIPLVWTLVYFGVVGSLYVKFMRYMLPLLPLLAIYGARMLWVASLRICKFAGGKCAGSLCAVLASLVFLPTLLYALAFLGVYRGEHPWLKLSRWIYAHVPPGATIAYEQWDHRLPLTLDQAGVTRWPGEYEQPALDMYAPDTPEKLRALLERLAASDYVVIASNRLYGSTARWPERYPLTRRYYQCLFEGRLGYQWVALPGVARQPRLGPLALDSDPFGAAGLSSPVPPEQAPPAPLTLHLGRADESFTVYDHPRPLLFWNVEHLSVGDLERLCADSFDIGD